MTDTPANPAETAAKDSGAQRFEARAFFIEDIAENTRILRFELNNGKKLNFRPGQYAVLEAPGIPPRPFSIASAPQRPYLEFHVKNSGHGVSSYLFNSLRIGSEVVLEAPLGDHYWRASDRPLLAIAGGVGIAPLKAVIEAQLEHAPKQETHLYWGVRDAAHLYLDKAFRDLKKAHPAFHYVPLLAKDAENTGNLRQLHAGPAILEDFTTLKGFDIYMAGPAAMVEATLPLLLERGAEKDFIFSDAFGG